MTRFPLPDKPRLWGTAVSHYQVEGGDPCDWTEWEREGRTRGEPCGAAYLERAAAEHCDEVMFAGIEPLFGNLHGDGRFHALLSRLGLR
jgi:hypothetical protein